MIKVTIEFPTPEAAIEGLAKFAGLGKYASPAAKGGATSQAAPAAGEATGRRGRSDKGQKRGEYAPRAPEKSGAGVTAESVPAVPAEMNAISGAQSTPTSPAAPAVESAASITPDAAGSKTAAPAAATSATPTPTPAPAAAATKEEAQSALEKLFEARGMEAALGAMSRFGVKRLRDMKPEHYGEFKALAEGIVAGTAQL